MRETHTKHLTGCLLLRCFTEINGKNCFFLFLRSLWNETTYLVYKCYMVYRKINDTAEVRKQKSNNNNYFQRVTAHFVILETGSYTITIIRIIILKHTHICLCVLCYATRTDVNYGSYNVFHSVVSETERTYFST